MRSSSLLLALVPLFGLLELGLHHYFARRAPGFDDYAALAPELLAAKQPNQPLVVAPAWAEPLLRQAAPNAFPLAELARSDDSAYASFLEVSLLGASAPELASFPVRERRTLGPFELLTHQNPKPDPTRYDFVGALDEGAVEVALSRGSGREPCRLVRERRGSSGGLHGHVAKPSGRYQCDGEHIVTATLIEDQNYRPHRCILVEPPSKAAVVLSFNGAPATPRLVGFAGYSYFIGRDFAQSHRLTVFENGRELGTERPTGSAGWSRFELRRPAAGGRIEVSIEADGFTPADFCFALEAR
jgi:hypothetical protein